MGATVEFHTHSLMQNALSAAEGCAALHQAGMILQMLTDCINMQGVQVPHTCLTQHLQPVPSWWVQIGSLEGSAAVTHWESMKDRRYG